MKKYVLLSLVIMGATAVVLLMMGRLPFCKCGVIRLWSGDIWSNQNSQQLVDPYSLTHITHGIALYGLLWLAGRRWEPGIRLVAAVLLESAWEIFENTDFVINRYREETISLDYYGDSVLNVMGDIGTMIFGFWIASKLSVRTTLIVAVLLEVGLLITIRDSLVLNIIMLIFPSDTIRHWQTGAFR
jgi:hypothetical protein